MNYRKNYFCCTRGPTYLTIVTGLRTSILKASNFNTIPFLTNLTKQLHDDFKVEYREEGAPLRPDDTFNLKKGSCRDLSWMQINLLRQLGIAARFVSGYYYFDMDEPAYELHGWTFYTGNWLVRFRS
jgi:transglutaminase-like putative cysteine protease